MPRSSRNDALDLLALVRRAAGRCRRRCSAAARRSRGAAARPRPSSRRRPRRRTRPARRRLRSRSRASSLGDELVHRPACRAGRRPVHRKFSSSCAAVLGVHDLGVELQAVDAARRPSAPPRTGSSREVATRSKPRRQRGHAVAVTHPDVAALRARRRTADRRRPRARAPRGRTRAAPAASTRPPSSCMSSCMP